MYEKPSRGTTNVSDVLDRVMDKGIVINAETSFQLVGMVLYGADSRIVVTSIETHLEYANFLADSAPTSRHPTRWAGGGTAVRDPGRNRIGLFLRTASTERDA